MASAVIVFGVLSAAVFFYIAMGWFEPSRPLSGGSAESERAAEREPVLAALAELERDRGSGRVTAEEYESIKTRYHRELARISGLAAG